ncbi:MAG: hydroxyacid dehydrogenase [Desulfobacterales bacterium]|nr:hydroxyacid dehydrogenase [Desulfobacterales bacterium]
MSKLKRVLLPQPIEVEAIALLEGAGCKIVTARNPKPETVIPLLPDAEAIVLRTGIKITRDLISRAENLKIIARTGGGVDNVDVAAATERGVIVTSNVGVNTISVVEHALSLMLALSKQLSLMDRSVRSGQFSVRFQNLPRDLRGQTLGLMGFGRIGSTLGEACRQIFGMKVLAYDPFLPEELKQSAGNGVKFVARETLFSQSDIISIHIPLTEGTRHAVGAKEFAMMKPEALLINTSRGPVVDEAALAEALQEKKIGGAGLDVLEQEPPAADSKLLKLDNVILTPHTAALTRECVIRMATEAAECVIDVLTGKEPRNIANRDVLKNKRWEHLVGR